MECYRTAEAKPYPTSCCIPRLLSGIRKMERRTPAKPYRKVLSLYPQYKEEIDRLPHKFYEVISRYPYKKWTYGMEKEDFFSNLVLCCYEADADCSRSKFLASACCKIDAMLSKQRKETAKLYNPYRNLYLEKMLWRKQNTPG